MSVIAVITTVTKIVAVTPLTGDLARGMYQEQTVIADLQNIIERSLTDIVKATALKPERTDQEGVVVGVFRDVIRGRARQNEDRKRMSLKVTIEWIWRESAERESETTLVGTQLQNR
jgi:hypothetical protein